MTIPLFQHFSPDPSIAPVVTQTPFGIAPEPGLALLNAVRDQAGLAPLAGPEEIWRAPLHLYYTAKPFELDLEFPSSFRFIGAGVWEPPADRPEWLDRLDAPLVLVSVSSEMQHDAALVEVALGAFRDERRAAECARRALAPARTAAREGERHDLPWRHGHDADARGRRPGMRGPVRRDQLAVGARVAAVGAGTCLMPDQLSPDSLRAAAREATAMRDGAGRIADAFAAAGGAAAAADSLESQLAVSTP